MQIYDIDGDGFDEVITAKNFEVLILDGRTQPDREIVTNEDNVPDKGFWEILEEMQNPKPAKQPVPTPKRKKKQQQVADPSPFLAAEKVTDKQSPAGNRLVVPSTEEEIPLTDIEFDNAAELRKAVIYTEILNRKY